MTSLTLFELRRYRTQPGQRDALIALFEAEFQDAYEAAGATILGSFRVADDPDRWVWIRAFRDSAARAAALEGFYASAVWQARRAQTRALIASSSDAQVFACAAGDLSPPPGKAKAGLIKARRYRLRAGEEAAFATACAEAAAPAYAASGARWLAALTPAQGPNTYPRQRVRTGAAAVTFARFADAAAHAAFLASPSCGALEAAFKARTRAAPELWRLEPAARSALR